MPQHRTAARARRGFAALALALLAVAVLAGAAGAAQQKQISLAFSDELLALITTDSQGEQTADIVNRIVGLSPELLNVRLQRTSGRVSLFLTVSADEDVPLDFQLTLDKMAYYRMRTARTDASGMTQALQEAKSFEPLLLDIGYRHDGRYAFVDCTIDLRPSLKAARQLRERREEEARAAAQAQVAASAKAAEESRATAALRAAASAKSATKSAVKSGGGEAGTPAPGPGGAPAPAAPPAQQEGRLAARALGREAEPVIDGLFSDAAWLSAERFTFDVRGASGKIPVAAWAVWSPERIWVMVRWPDATRDNEHRPWIWSKEAKAYVAGREIEDALSLTFAREGRIGECMLSGRESVSDQWTWRAARTDPTGFAEDATLTLSLKPLARAPSYPARNGALVFVQETPDAGVGPYEVRPAGAFTGDRVPGFVTRTPSGSAGDVAAKASWKDGFWLVEFSRRLATGDPADVVFSPGRDAFLSLAIFNAREGANHSTSQEIVLRLE